MKSALCLSLAIETSARSSEYTGWADNYILQAQKSSKPRRSSQSHNQSDSDGSAAGYGERRTPKNKKRSSARNLSDSEYSGGSEDEDVDRGGLRGGRELGRKSRDDAERERREDPLVLEDLEKCRLSRMVLAEMKHRDCFAELVVGEWTDWFLTEHCALG